MSTMVRVLLVLLVLVVEVGRHCIEKPALESEKIEDKKKVTKRKI